MNLWNLKAPLYNLFRKPWPLNRILRCETKNIQSLLRLVPQQDLVALDIGCGAGSSIKLLNGKIKAIGLDGSFNMAKQAFQNTNCPVVVADSLALPFAANAFNLITAIGLLEYLEDIEAFFSFSAAALIPGGYLLVTSSPPGLFTTLRRVGGNKIHPRKADFIIDSAERCNLNLVDKKSCFSQDVFLFTLS